MDGTSRLPKQRACCPAASHMAMVSANHRKRVGDCIRGCFLRLHSVSQSPAPAAPCAPLCSVCLIAGDISPIDVITPLPVLCEDNDVPYIYVPSKVRRRKPRRPSAAAVGPVVELAPPEL